MWQKIKASANLIYKAGDNMVDHDGIEHAGYLSFVLLLAFFPFLVFFVAILGSLGETSMGAEFVRTIINNLPQSVIEVVLPRINEILSGPPAGLLTVSILGTIWTASSMIEGYRTILNRAYRVATPPNYYLRRALSIAQLLLLVCILIAAMFALVLAPILANKLYGLFDFLNSTSGEKIYDYKEISFLGVEWANIRYFGAIMVLFMFITALYYWLPNVKQSWIRTFPGAAIVLFGWILATKSFTYYLSNFDQVNLVYGSLGSIIAFLLFFYINNIIFIYGAEFNYLLEKSLGVKIIEREKVAAAAKAKNDKPKKTKRK